MPFNVPSDMRPTDAEAQDLLDATLQRVVTAIHDFQCDTFPGVETAAEAKLLVTRWLQDLLDTPGKEVDALATRAAFDQKAHREAATE